MCKRGGGEKVVEELKLEGANEEKYKSSDEQKNEMNNKNKNKEKKNGNDSSNGSVTRMCVTHNRNLI